MKYAISPLQEKWKAEALSKQFAWVNWSLLVIVSVWFFYGLHKAL